MQTPRHPRPAYLAPLQCGHANVRNRHDQADSHDRREGRQNGAEGDAVAGGRNTSDRELSGRFLVLPQGEAKPEWFAIAGPSATRPLEIERDFAGKGKRDLTVTVTVDASAAAGSYLFDVRVTCEIDPDNDFTDSPAVAFEIPKVEPTGAGPPPPRKFPWWAVAAAAALIVIVGGVVTYVVDPFGSKIVSVPDVHGRTVDIAKTMLTHEELTIGTESKEPTSAQPPDTVIRTIPAANEEVGKGTSVALIIAEPESVQVPPVIGKNLDDATAHLIAAGLKAKVIKVQDPDRADQVVATNPAAGSMQPKGSEVIVVYAVGPFIVDPRIIQLRRGMGADAIIRQVQPCDPQHPC